MTRPNISHAVHTDSQFVANPRKPHLAAVYRIIRYIRGPIDWGLLYSTSYLQRMAYVDANWASCPNPHSTIGWCMFVGTTPMSWKCKKQTSVSNRLLKRNITLSSASSEIVWLQRLL